MRRFIYSLCFFLLACNENTKSKQESHKSDTIFNGKVIDVPDSIIQKYKNTKDNLIFISSVYGYEKAKPVFYINCGNRAGIDFRLDGYGADCIALEIDNGRILRWFEKSHCPLIIPSKAEFSIGVYACTPKGKVFLQKRSYHAEESPLPKMQILVNRKKQDNPHIQKGDSLWLQVIPDYNFYINCAMDTKYWINRAEVFLKSKNKGLEHVGGADLMYRNVCDFPGLKIPIPKQFWEKDVEYMQLKVSGLSRKIAFLKDSLEILHNYDSIISVYKNP